MPKLVNLPKIIDSMLNLVSKQCDIKGVILTKEYDKKIPSYVYLDWN